MMKYINNQINNFYEYRAVKRLITVCIIYVGALCIIIIYIYTHTLFFSCKDNMYAEYLMHSLTKKKYISSSFYVVYLSNVQVYF